MEIKFRLGSKFFTFSIYRRRSTSLGTFKTQWQVINTEPFIYSSSCDQNFFYIMFTNDNLNNNTIFCLDSNSVSHQAIFSSHSSEKKYFPTRPQEYFFLIKISKSIIRQNLHGLNFLHDHRICLMIAENSVNARKCSNTFDVEGKHFQRFQAVFLHAVKISSKGKWQHKCRRKQTC